MNRKNKERSNASIRAGGTQSKAQAHPKMAPESYYCGNIVVVKVNTVFYWKQNTSRPHWSSLGDKKKA